MALYQNKEFQEDCSNLFFSAHKNERGTTVVFFFVRKNKFLQFSVFSIQTSAMVRVCGLCCPRQGGALIAHGFVISAHIKSECDR